MSKSTNPTNPTPSTSTAATTTAPKEQQQESSSGDAKFDALQKALKEKGIAAGQFNSGDETFRKRALKFDTPDSTYEKMKEEHQWLYDQPITPKTKEDQEAAKKSPEESTATGKVKA